MKVSVTKQTGISLLRLANSYTAGHESHMTLARAYALGHSPIRTQIFVVELTDIPLFVASQLVRSHVGVQWYQRTKRPDRGGESFREVCDSLADNLYDGGNDPTGIIRRLPDRFDRYAPTSLLGIMNAESIVNMSRKRLCQKASRETREVWEEVCSAVRISDPDLYPHLVRPCVATGVCREHRGCGFTRSGLFAKLREEYKRNFIDII